MIKARYNTLIFFRTCMSLFVHVCLFSYMYVSFNSTHSKAPINPRYNTLITFRTRMSLFLYVRLFFYMYVSFFTCMSLFLHVCLFFYMYVSLKVRTQSHLQKHETTLSFFSIHVCLVSYVYVSSKSVHSIAPIKARNYTLVSFPCVVLIGLFFISHINLVFMHVGLL